MSDYLHGFDPKEQRRLTEQAGILAPLVYKGVDFSGCKKLLEVGSGVGAQTRILLERYPNLHITCVDASEVQLGQARLNLLEFGDRVRFERQDGCTLSLDERFDAAFVCWTLEHVSSPLELLQRLKAHLLPGAKLVVTEVFNSSFYTTAGYDALQHYFEKMNVFQRKIGGDPDVGIRLGSLLTAAGFKSVSTQFEGFFLDKRSLQDRKRVFSFWKELLESAAPALLAAGHCSQKEVDGMGFDLKSMSEDENAIFFYQFVQAKATL
jgi:SAM-dependent methyltransferase